MQFLEFLNKTSSLCSNIRRLCKENKQKQKLYIDCNSNYFLGVRNCIVRFLDNGIRNALYASTGREACNFGQYYGSFIRLATSCNAHTELPILELPCLSAHAHESYSVTADFRTHVCMTFVTASDIMVSIVRTFLILQNN